MTDVTHDSESARDGGTATIDIEVTDVTGTQTAVATVPPSAPTHAVVESLMSSMALPRTSPYGLRDEATGRYLDDHHPIGEQLGPDAKVTVTPKTHLGGGANR